MLGGSCLARRSLLAKAAGPALLVVCAAGCRQPSPKLTPDNPVIEEVRLEGFDVLPVRAREDLRDDLPIRAGAALSSEAEKTAGERAVEVLQNYGFPYAQVALAREPIDAARTRVTL